jgi:hypothetical protein
MQACLCQNPRPDPAERGFCICKGKIIPCPDTATLYPDGSYVVSGKLYNALGQRMSAKDSIAWAQKGMVGIQRRPERRASESSEYAWMAM